jgi:two-component system, cell cycle sensor histidine kinase and response regulator CckA
VTLPADRRADFSPPIHSSPAFFIAIARNGKVLTMNRELIATLGLDPQEAVGRDYLSFVRAEDHDQMLEDVHALADRRLSRLRIVGLCAKDGRVVFVEWHGWPVRRADGEIDCVLATGLDVTDRQQMLQYRQAIFDAVTDIIAVLDERGVIIDGNESLARSRGCPLRELLGRDIRDLASGAPPFTVEAASDLIHHALAGEEQLFEWPAPHGWVEVSLRRAEIGDRRVLLAVVRDVTGRKQSEEALRESEERFRTLAEQSVLGIAILSGAQLVFCNEVLAAICCATREEMLSWGYAEMLAMVHPADRPLALDELLKRKAGQDLQGRYELRIRHRQGTRWLSIFARHIQLRGQPAIEAVVLDITERRRVEEERQRLELRMQHAQKLESLGVLAGGIAHDFNNLLVGVLGNAGLALTEIPEGSPAHRRLHQIEVAAQRAAELTQQMLAYSGRGRFLVETIHLDQVVDEMSHLLRASISKMAQLSCDFAPQLPTIEADAAQLHQVIMNLITNASEALGERGGTIIVRTGVLHADRATLSATYLDDELPEGRYVYLEVADTGCGMDGETQARIFDPFFTTKTTGRGLGLAAVLGIVRSHHGAIKVSSERGQGTVFRVLFPAHDVEHVETRSVTAETTEWRGQGTILIVDDEPIARDVAAQTLTRYGFEVLLAENGREAVDVVHAQGARLAAVLLDLTMPQMNGEEALREIRALRPDLPVILSSGYSEQEAGASLGAKQPAGFLQKPYRPTQLVEKLRAILATID